MQKDGVTDSKNTTEKKMVVQYHRQKEKTESRVMTLFGVMTSSTVSSGLHSALL